MFHLKQLTAKGFIRKRIDAYHLTKAGLMVSGALDINSLAERKHKTLYIGFVCKRGDKWLLRQRESGAKKLFKFPGYKPLLGETMAAARCRLFTLETGLELPDSEFKYRSTHFKIQRTSKEEALFDDVLVLYDVDITHRAASEISGLVSKSLAYLPVYGQR